MLQYHTILYHITAQSPSRNLGCTQYDSPAHKTAQRSVAWHHCVAHPYHAICNLYRVTSYSSGGFISHPLYHSMICCIRITEFCARVIYHPLVYNTLALHCIRTARVVLVGWMGIISPPPPEPPTVTNNTGKPCDTDYWWFDTRPSMLIIGIMK